MDKQSQKFLDSIHFTAYEQPSLRSNTLFISMIIFLILMLLWISFASIDEIVKGQGKVIPSSRIQNIQSFDGGSIEKILVKEGTFVKRGQELMIIDDVRFNSSVDELKNDLYSLKSKFIRLKSQSLIESIDDIQPLIFPKDWPEIAIPYRLNEIGFYDNRIEELKSLVSVERSKYKQKQQEYNEIKRKIRKLEDTTTYTKDQLVFIKKGVDDGVMSKIEYIKLQKEYSDMLGELDISRLALKRSQTSIEESRQNIQQQIDIFKSESSGELTKIDTEIKKVESKLMLSNDRVQKSVIHSPVDGIVNHIYFTTVGGVVKEADVLMDIVPTDDSLLIEAKINPKDIGFISPKNEVTVKVSAYDFSIYGGLKGKIEQIGADSMYDKETKKYFYQVLVRTDKNYLGSKEKPLMIIPGMISDTDIKTGKKTILEYLMKPITKTVSNALTER